MSRPVVCSWREGAPITSWRPTTLADLGKNEEFLEQLIVDRPDLLGLPSLSVPCKEFRQRRVVNAQDRVRKPDIIFLTSKGEVVIVEVKLHNNAELGDRRVISQIVDYAASLHSQKSEELLQLFQIGDILAGSWPVLVGKLFPDVEDAGELADELQRRLRTGEVHFVIACDRAPKGLYELVEGVASQRALAFDFDVVELRPYVCDDEKAGVLFFRNTAVKTEIVKHTCVTVTIEKGATDPVVKTTVKGATEMDAAAAEAADMGPHHTYEAKLPDGTPVYISRVLAPVAVVVNRHKDGKNSKFSIIAWTSDLMAAKRYKSGQERWRDKANTSDVNIWNDPDLGVLHPYGIPLESIIIDKIIDLGETTENLPPSTPRGATRKVVGE